MSPVPSCTFAIGSSPPTRGTPSAGLTPTIRCRFIPAHAGNTRIASACAFASAVHPRPRGEHPRHPDHSFSRSGSSPPTRGTHNAYLLVLQSNRFIPAHAGNTTSGGCSPRPRWGSSPPTRGTLMRNKRFTGTRIQTGITHDIARLIRYASQPHCRECGWFLLRRPEGFFT